MYLQNQNLEEEKELDLTGLGVLLSSRTKLRRVMTLSMYTFSLGYAKVHTCNFDVSMAVQ
jgi:hypothetical protein